MSSSYFSTDFIRKLAIPRLAGTEGELKAQQLIEEELKKLDIPFEAQEFFYSHFRNSILRIYDIILGTMMITCIFMMFFTLYPIALLLIMSLFLLAYFSRTVKEKMSFFNNARAKKYKSRNYIAKIPAKKEDSKTKTIILLAHYDSKSITLHPIFEGAIYFFGLVGGSIFAIHAGIVVLLAVFNIIPFINIIQFFYIFPLLGLYSIEFFNKTGNESPGANDNACAVADGFYLLAKFKNTPLDNVNLMVVFTGVEEFGEIGSYHFIKKYRAQLPKGRTYFLVVDSVGGNKDTNTCIARQGLVKSLFSPYLEQQVRLVLESESGSKFKMDFLHVPPLIPFTTDHTPIKPHGYDFLIFTSNNRWHSKADDINNYIPEMLDQFNKFARELVIQINDN